MSELKCCPFCGGEAEVDLTNQHDKLFIVGCNTPMCYGNINHFTMVFVNKETAIETWNTRTPMANIVEKLEERRIEYKLSSIKAPDEMSTVYRKGVMRGYEYSRDLVKQEINNGLE